MNQISRTVFCAFIRTAFSNSKRTYWRGLFAGILAYLFTLAVLFLAFFFLKPFVWFTFTNAPYPSVKEPLDPDSVEWLALQGMNFVTWFAAGTAVGRWSPPKTWAVVATLYGFVMVLSLFAAVPATHSAFRLVCWFLGSPLAIIFGNVFYRRREARFSILPSS